MGIVNNNDIISSKEKELEDDMEEWKNERYSGIGIKRMKAYICNLSLSELNKRREKFWKNKINPKNKNWIIWKIIHQAITYDEHRSKLLLEEYEISPLNGCINHLIDNNGNEYNIPNYCINDPYFERNINENDNIPGKTVVKIRFYRYGGEPPITLEVNKLMTGKDLKNIFKKYSNINEDKNIRMFISGIEIQNNQFLYQHNINEEKPIYVIIN